MKKSTINSTTTTSQNYSQFVGKNYQLTKHNVSIEDVIAEGGFSIVFLAKSNQNGKKYALKRMYVNNEHDLEACRLEIQIIKNLSDTNKFILKYIDSSIQRQSSDIYEILLLTKYCKLGGLVQLMNDRLSSNLRFQENEVLKIFCDTCEALADLHANGIIHRDLKVENILIDEEITDKKANSSNALTQFKNFNFVLCDFGSSTKNFYDRKLNSSSQLTQKIADEIQKYTTLSYRSPEMVDLYSDKPITTKSDIWALGCLLYKICYFQMPFAESLLAIQEGRFQIPDLKSNYYSKQINILINYMLEPDPLKRPDIYQVSYLAFQLAQRQCFIKNINKSEIPNINSLQAPLTESEWKKTSLTTQTNTTSTNNQKKSLLNQDSVQLSTNTTVNPRERPKASNLATNNTNSIIPLVSNANNNQGLKQKGIVVTQPKLNVSIKPAAINNNQNTTTSNFINAFQETPNTPLTQQQQQQQQQFGFEDDFSTLKSNNLLNQQQQMAQQTPQEQQLITKSPLNTPIQQFINTVYIQQSQPSQPNIYNPNEKKTHRRSASHSSTLFTNLNQSNLYNYNTNNQQRLTPSQLQQQIQYQIQQQQQQQQQIYQYQQQTPSLNLNNNNRLLVSHSRSASAASNNANLIMNEEVKMSNMNEAVQRQQTNPFDDNDLFGIEFDKIRCKNEQSGDSNSFIIDKTNSLSLNQQGNNAIMNNINYNLNHNNNNNNNNNCMLNNYNYQNYYRNHMKSNSCSNINFNLINIYHNNNINNHSNHMALNNNNNNNIMLMNQIYNLNNNFRNINNTNNTSNSNSNNLMMMMMTGTNRNSYNSNNMNMNNFILTSENSSSAKLNNTTNDTDLFITNF